MIDEIEPAWSPDGTRIAYRQVPQGISGSIGELHVIDISGGATSSQHLATGGYVSDPAWSPRLGAPAVRGHIPRATAPTICN